jgi:hypothetical protein
MMEEEVNATLYPLWAKIVTTHGVFIRRFVVIPDRNLFKSSWEYVFVVEVHIGVLTVTNNKNFTVASAQASGTKPFKFPGLYNSKFSVPILFCCTKNKFKILW